MQHIRLGNHSGPADRFRRELASAAWCAGGGFEVIEHPQFNRADSHVACVIASALLPELGAKSSMGVAEYSRI